MKKAFILLLLLPNWGHSQSIKECKQRFDNYLNFKNSLDRQVRIDSSGIYMTGADKKQLVFYSSELGVLARFFSNVDLDRQLKFLEFKGNKKLSISQLDSLRLSCERGGLAREVGAKPLKSCKIALDPGHFATNLAEAKFEQKFLYFPIDPLHAGDSVKIFESSLTFNTAKLLEAMLSEMGAEVFLTRSKSNFTSFNCTYSDWLKRHKTRVLDSLVQQKVMTPEKRRQLNKADGHKFFWDFFRDFDLVHRAELINAYQPDLTVIIHYNVDEKNAPWKKTTEKDYTMAFIGGAFSASDLVRKESRAHFVRMLLSDRLDLSEKLAQKTVHNFHKNLGIKVATAADADYLKDYCLPTSSSGVFCRNLLLCRKVNSVLVYGESLYQDNEKEAKELMKTDSEKYGIQSNARLMAVARSYFEAILDFYKNE